jgi:tRNA(Ile)-lysidine synthase
VDSSNCNKRYLRNSIRLELIPMMLSYQPRLLELLGRSSEIIRDEDAFLESMALEWVEKKTERDNKGNIKLNLPSIKDLPTPLKKRVLRRLLKEVSGNRYPMEYDHIASVIGVMEGPHPQSSLDLPYDISVRKVYDNLYLKTKETARARGYGYVLEVPGRFFLDATGQTIELEEMAPGMEMHWEGDASTAYFDAEKLSAPIIIRNFRHGDRFVPLGMRGQKKVKKFFIDLKVPSEKRALTPILTSEDNLAWICGYRIDDRFKVTRETRKIIRVRVIQEGL